MAENLSDGVIAPLIFIFIGGAPLGMAYKAVNTLDSMLGYRNEEFEYFGKFAARLDDAVNLRLQSEQPYGHNYRTRSD